MPQHASLTAGPCRTQVGVRVTAVAPPVEPPPESPALTEICLGCDGLRYLPGPTSGLFVGLNQGHGRSHKARAILEGMALELCRWRIGAKVSGTDPIRLLLESPWGTESAKIVSNLTGEQVALWAGGIDRAAHLGQVLALAREGGHNPTPRIQLDLIEPTMDASILRRYLALHHRLMIDCAGLLGSER